MLQTRDRKGRDIKFKPLTVGISASTRATVVIPSAVAYLINIDLILDLRKASESPVTPKVC